MDEAYLDHLLGAVFGDDHAPAFPDVWHLTLLDVSGDELVGFERVQVPNTSELWEVDEGTAVNLEPIDMGVSDGTTVGGVGLMDEYGTPVFTTMFDDPLTPTVGEPLAFEPGGLTIVVGDEE